MTSAEKLQSSIKLYNKKNERDFKYVLLKKCSFAWNWQTHIKVGENLLSKLRKLDLLVQTAKHIIFSINGYAVSFLSCTKMGSLCYYYRYSSSLGTGSLYWREELSPSKVILFVKKNLQEVSQFIGMTINYISFHTFHGCVVSDDRHKHSPQDVFQFG